MWRYAGVGYFVFLVCVVNGNKDYSGHFHGYWCLTPLCTGPLLMWAIENNLSLMNMIFEEFAIALDDGIIRGFLDQPE